MSRGCCCEDTIKVGFNTVGLTCFLSSEQEAVSQLYLDVSIPSVLTERLSQCECLIMYGSCTPPVGIGDTTFEDAVLNWIQTGNPKKILILTENSRVSGGCGNVWGSTESFIQKIGGSIIFVDNFLAAAEFTPCNSLGNKLSRIVTSNYLTSRNEFVGICGAGGIESGGVGLYKSPDQASIPTISIETIYNDGVLLVVADSNSVTGGLGFDPCVSNYNFYNDFISGPIDEIRL